MVAGVDVRFVGLLALLVERDGTHRALSDPDEKPPPAGWWSVRWYTPHLMGRGRVKAPASDAADATGDLAAQLAACPAALLPDEAWPKPLAQYRASAMRRWSDPPYPGSRPTGEELASLVGTAVAWPEAPAGAGEPPVVARVVAAPWEPLPVATKGGRALAGAEWLSHLAARCDSDGVARIAESLWRWGNEARRDSRAPGPFTAVGGAHSTASVDLIMERNFLAALSDAPLPRVLALCTASSLNRACTTPGRPDRLVLAITLAALARAVADDRTTPTREFASARNELAELLARHTPTRRDGGVRAFLAGR